MDQNKSDGGQTRPALMADLTSTQLDALELQFNEGDRPEWNVFTKSYGWTQDESNAVWNWFDQGSGEGGSGERPEGFSAEGSSA
ncbi:MAG: hypothetical protein ACR2M0_16355 [Chloroflexia bacterium]